MKTIQVLSGQTLVDIAMQELGDASRLFELAELNGLLPSDNIVAGQSILVPDLEVNKAKTVNLLQVNQPATYSYSEEVVPLEGVDYWGIGFDFEIS